MRMADIKAIVLDEFDYGKTHYMPLFSFWRAPVIALFIWMAAMTVILSMAIDVYPTLLLPELLGEVTKIGSVLMLICLLILCAASFYEWDKLNGFLYFIESLIAWGSFKIATLIQFEIVDIGRLTVMTIIGSVMAMTFCYIADRNIKKVYGYDRNKRR